MQHKETDEYKIVVIKSKKRMDEQERTSRRMWWARTDFARGEFLAEQRDEDYLDFHNISPEDQEPVHKHDTGKAEKTLRSLEAVRSPIYRGTHVKAFA